MGGRLRASFDASFLELLVKDLINRDRGGPQRAACSRCTPQLSAWQLAYGRLPVSPLRIPITVEGSNEDLAIADLACTGRQR